MKTVLLLAGAALAAIATPTAAAAADFVYTLTGPAGGYSASWQMPPRPLPDQATLGEGFSLFRVSGTFPGTTAGDAYLDFFSAANGGGLSIFDADGPDLLISLSGAQLYSVPETSPLMRRGTFQLTEATSGAIYTLDVAGVPEPASWAMMIGGFGLAGGALRGRVRRTTIRFA